ncbi:MAG: aldehyde dehydrogenase [Deltaproteobacteria bacterium]|nr:aldehyde dehydrogenase [Deltaproteobacteria bacterium]
MDLVSYDPATSEPVGAVPVTPAEDVAAIVGRAREAMPAWRDLGADARAALLVQAGPVFLARADALGELLSREQGKPLREGVGEVKSCGWGLREELDDIIAALAPETLEDKRTRTVLHRDPFGVCAAITPWNFPISMCAWMVIPALMAGNTVVMKPSEETPLIAQAYADVLNEFLPQGVLQVVHGGDAVGKALVAAEVDLIAFTGSREAGSHILAAASKDLKRVMLELGGKDAMVVLDDADVSKAARFAARNSFRNCGQVCVSTERIYVHEDIAPAFEEALTAEAKGFVVGRGLDAATKVGPMINRHQKEHVLGQVRSAVADGARPLLGHEQADSPEEGNFVRPIVLADVGPDLDIMVRETFGPVACIDTFATDDEAVASANRGIYGLGAVVFGGDLERAAAVARRLDAGMIGVNRGVGGAGGAPWVGAKQSGYGFHSGRDGHRQFAQVRIVSLPV